MLLSAIIFILASTVTAIPSTLDRRGAVTCYLKGVYVIAARGTEEPAGYGAPKALVDDILAAIPNSGSVAVDYPASFLDPPYPKSVDAGVKALEALVTAYHNSCKGGKVVLVGFSQGANIVSDSLVGGILRPMQMTGPQTSISIFIASCANAKLICLSSSCCHRLW
jgi:acetylxylan esterase